MEKFHIEKNTIQETLVIPLYGRKVCSKHFPELFDDPEATKICDSLDYDFSEKGKRLESTLGLFGALEVAQRQTDMIFEIKDFLKAHPNAAVVNLGCGLDDTFKKCDNGSCIGYNLDMPDVIAIRNKILPESEREKNLSCDLMDFSWMDKIDSSSGVIFFASGVLYYFTKEDVRKLLIAMAEKFKTSDGIFVFDVSNKRATKLMVKHVLKHAGMKNVSANFSIEKLEELSNIYNFKNVSEKSYMRGYRDIYPNVRFLYKILIKICDNKMRMKIVRIEF